MNREDELFIAKKTAEKAGYKVTLPGAAPAAPAEPAAQPAGDGAAPAPTTQVPRFRTMSRSDYAARQGQQQAGSQRPSMADRLATLAAAAKTAEAHGYHIRKATPEEIAARQAAQTPTPAEPAPAPAPAAPAEPTPAAPAAPAAPEKKTNPYLSAAARFMRQD
jgi:hypothetical protein